MAVLIAAPRASRRRQSADADRPGPSRRSATAAARTVGRPRRWRPSASHRAAATAANTASDPLTGRCTCRIDVTSTRGIARAWRMPNDRMVRSWTTPSRRRRSLRTHQPERLVRGADAVGAQDDVVERPDRRPPRSRSSRRICNVATARPPDGAGHLDRERRSCRSPPIDAEARRDRQRGRLRPHRRAGVEGERRSGERDLLEDDARRDPRDPVDEPVPTRPEESPRWASPTRSTPDPSAAPLPRPAAASGRDAPRPRATRGPEPLRRVRSPARRRRPRPVSDASRRRPRRSRQADAGAPPGTHHEASGSR